MSAALEAEVAALRERVAVIERSRLMPPLGLGVPLFQRTKQERIVQLVAAEWHVDPADVAGRIREGFAIQPRFAAIWLARQIMRVSLPVLGRLFGRDHTSIMRALRRADGWREADDDFRRATDRILVQLRAEFAA